MTAEQGDLDRNRDPDNVPERERLGGEQLKLRWVASPAEELAAGGVGRNPPTAGGPSDRPS